MSVADILRQQCPGALPNSFFERVGGRPTLDRVHRCFYGKIYAHPWVGQYFVHADRDHLERTQSDFMTGQFDGGQIFCGRPPAQAHLHLAISEELFDLRQELLGQALTEEGISGADRQHWLEVDAKFRPVLLREAEDCQPLSSAQGILNFPNPETVPACLPTDTPQETRKLRGGSSSVD